MKASELISLEEKMQEARQDLEEAARVFRGCPCQETQDELERRHRIYDEAFSKLSLWMRMMNHDASSDEQP